MLGGGGASQEETPSTLDGQGSGKVFPQCSTAPAGLQARADAPFGPGWGWRGDHAQTGTNPGCACCEMTSSAVAGPSFHPDPGCWLHLSSACGSETH